MAFANIKTFIDTIAPLAEISEKEVELGIDGMSSERILVREELKNR